MRNTISNNSQGVLKLYPSDKTNPDSTYLQQFQKNIMSQSGIDGIVEHIFEILGTSNKWAVEFGAWDGKLYSNSWNLINNHDWKSVFIEGNSAKYLDLLDTYECNPNVIPVNTYVAIEEGLSSLDEILKTYNVPQDFDFLSVDVDGCDWYIWQTLQAFRPRLIVIEFNPTIPNYVLFIQPKDVAINQGCSLRALIELGKEKGYELVATTGWNAFFVRKEDFPRFKIQDNSIDAMHNSDEFASTIFQLYDGTLVLAGCTRLLWHNISLNANDIHVLPEAFRKFGDAAISNNYTGIRLADLKLLSKVLKQYHAENASYPLSEGFDGFYTSWGKAGQNWISGLTPKYLYTLPREPKQSDDPRQQYLYRSNGKDYKLICHGVEDVHIVAQTHPKLIDPQRNTWAYGYWTQDAANW